MPTNDTPRRRSSGRARIVAWIVGVTALGLTLLVVGASFALRATMNEDIESSLAQEAGEIQRFSDEAVDPATSRPFATAAGFINTYLARQQPERTESLVGESLAPPASATSLTETRGADSPPFDDLDPQTKAAILVPGSAGTRSSLGHGTVSWRNVAVTAPDGAGFIAVVEFHEPREADVQRQLGALLVLATGALAITGVMAWLVSGRILLPVSRFERAASQVASSSDLRRLPERGGPEEIRLATAGNSLLDGAESALEQEQQFSDDLTHELRTPLAILRGALEQPGTSVEQMEASRRHALGEVLRLEGLVTDLVVLNRVGRPEYFQPIDGVDVGDFTREFVRHWTVRAPERASDVGMGEAAQVETTIDEPRLAAALDELVDNAFTASTTGTPVTVSSTVIDEGTRSTLVFEVTDSGRGVPDDEREAVLERFRRASNDPNPGDGLGLTVAARLAEGMGGRVTLTPNPVREGTIARLELPLPETDAQ